MEGKSSYLSLISFRFCRENQIEQKSEIISGTVHMWLCNNTCGQRSRSLTVSQHFKEKVMSCLKPHNSHFPHHSCTKYSLSKQALRSLWEMRTSKQGNQHLPRGSSDDGALFSRGQRLQNIHHLSNKRYSTPVRLDRQCVLNARSLLRDYVNVWNMKSKLKHTEICSDAKHNRHGLKTRQRSQNLILGILNLECNEWCAWEEILLM